MICRLIPRSFWLLLVMISCVAVFALERAMEDIERKTDRLGRDITYYQQQIRILEAEYSYLTRPDRLEILARKYLDLATPSPRRLAVLNSDSSGLPLQADRGVP